MRAAPVVAVALDELGNHDAPFFRRHRTDAQPVAGVAAPLVDHRAADCALPGADDEPAWSQGISRRERDPETRTPQPADEIGPGRRSDLFDAGGQRHDAGGEMAGPRVCQGTDAVVPVEAEADQVGEQQPEQEHDDGASDQARRPEAHHSRSTAGVNM